MGVAKQAADVPQRATQECVLPVEHRGGLPAFVDGSDQDVSSAHIAVNERDARIERTEIARAAADKVGERIRTSGAESGAHAVPSKPMERRSQRRVDRRSRRLQPLARVVGQDVERTTTECREQLADRLAQRLHRGPRVVPPALVEGDSRYPAINHTRVGQRPIGGVESQKLRDRQPSLQRVEHCGLFRRRVATARKDSNRQALGRSDRCHSVDRIGQTIFETLDAGDTLACMCARDQLASMMKAGRGGG